MNARKITIISTRDQKQSVIMSTAETLGDLKADMQEAGISYEGLTFHERISKVELKENSARLPHDVPYRGNVTNELVFLLTNTETKIKSGLLSRVEAYAFIKAHNLQDECIAAFGRNFTQCQTTDLESLINDYKARKEEEAAKVQVDNVKIAPTFIHSADFAAREALRELVDALWDRAFIDVAVRELILDHIDTPLSCEESKPSYKKEGTSPYSDEELQDLIGDVNIY